MQGKYYLIVSGQHIPETLDILYGLGFKWVGGEGFDDCVVRRSLSGCDFVAIVMTDKLLSWLYDHAYKTITPTQIEDLEEGGYSEIILDSLLRENKLERILGNG